MYAVFVTVFIAGGLWLPDSWVILPSNSIQSTGAVR